jgi:hypothetical protein
MLLTLPRPAAYAIVFAVTYLRVDISHRSIMNVLMCCRFIVFLLFPSIEKYRNLHHRSSLPSHLTPSLHFIYFPVTELPHVFDPMLFYSSIANSSDRSSQSIHTHIHPRTDAQFSSIIIVFQKSLIDA